MNEILAIILKDTFTYSQLNSRLRAAKAQLLKKFFGGGGDVSSLPQELQQQFNKDNFYQVFEALGKQIQQLPILTMYLTFEPDEITSSQIGSFARKTFGPNLLLDIKLNPALIAGCSLVWKGRLRDYSLKARLDEKKKEILENFKKFLR